jgi:hypothetical protein
LAITTVSKLLSEEVLNCISSFTEKSWACTLADGKATANKATSKDSFFIISICEAI